MFTHTATHFLSFDVGGTTWLKMGVSPLQVNTPTAVETAADYVTLEVAKERDRQFYNSCVTLDKPQVGYKIQPNKPQVGYKIQPR